MGQKTNPTLIRLEKSNTHHKSCWYSHRFYPEQLHSNYNHYLYINKVFNKIKNTNHCIHGNYGHQHAQLMCLFPKKRMRTQFKKPSKNIKHFGEYLNTSLKIPYLTLLFAVNKHFPQLNKSIVDSNKVSLAHKKNSICYNTNQNRIQNLFFFYSLYLEQIYYPIGSGSKNKDYKSFLQQTIEQSHARPVRASSGSKHFAVTLRPKNALRSLRQVPGRGDTLCFSNSNSFMPLFKKTNICFIKCRYWQSSAEFLIQKISMAIKNRIRFPRLRKQILWDCRRTKWIKGIRVTLSGRSEMRSKKAQKARSRTFQWGQTELQVFSSLVQFSKQDCVTPFGIVGIKLWICYGPAG